MFQKAQFLKSVYKIEDLPPPEHPEVAILGRSNAGKSSLLNVLLNQKKLAKVSSTPGFTQALNFYLVDNRFFFVDLPGYGFAKVPREVHYHWKVLVEKYLRSIRDFRVLLLIFDIRRRPDHLDRTLLQFVVHLQIPFTLLLNKIDLLNSKEREVQKELYLRELSSLRKCEIFLISCKEKVGLESLRAHLKKILQREDLITL